MYFFFALETGSCANIWTQPLQLSDAVLEWEAPFTIMAEFLCPAEERNSQQAAFQNASICSLLVQGCEDAGSRLHSKRTWSRESKQAYFLSNHYLTFYVLCYDLLNC